MRVKLFGTLEIARPDGERLGPRHFGGVKPKEVLEILLLAGGHAVSKDRLADLVWGERLPKQVTGTLETYVSVIRGRLGGGQGRRATGLVTEPGAYRFDLAHAELDVHRFDALLAAAAAQPDRARSFLEEALAVAGGEVLEDAPYAEWAVATREKYRQRRMAARLDAAEAALNDGDPRAAAELADQGIAADRLSERAYQLAMAARHLVGDRVGALQAFRRCAEVLARDVGVGPTTHTQALAAAIARGDPGAALAGLAPCGAAPARPVVGLAGELSQISAALSAALAGSFSIVLVEGGAGAGKTRLLNEVAARLSPFPVGRSRCSEGARSLPHLPLLEALRPLVSAAGPARATSEARPAPRSGPARRYGDMIEAAVRRCAPFVLVLDDLHWADKSTVTLLAELVRRCRDVPGAVVAAYRPGPGPATALGGMPEVALHLHLAPSPTGPRQGTRVLEGEGGAGEDTRPLPGAAC